MTEHEPAGLRLAFERQTREVYGKDSLPLSVVQINPFFEGQIRQTYNQDDIATLADSLAEDDLFHPLMVAELGFLEAVEYVGGINELWGTTYSAANLTENEQGNYYLLIAGHRRLKAIYYNISDSGRERSEVKVHCSVHRDIGLTKALKLQYTENSHRAVEPSRDALAIKLYYNRRFRELESDNKKYSYSQCARELGVSWDTVKNAELYFTLPPGTRSTVDEGLYKYQWVLKLVGFHDALVAARPSWTEENRVSELTAVLQKSRDEKFSAPRFERYLEDRVEGLAYEQKLLALSEEFVDTTPQSRADRAAESLMGRALEDTLIVLGHLALGQVNDPRPLPYIRQRVARAEELLRFINDP